MFRLLRKLIRLYFITCGILAHLALLAALWFVLDYHQLTPAQLALKVLEKAQLDIPELTAFLTPAPRYADHVLDGALRQTHPRIVLPELAGWDGNGPAPLMRARLQRQADDPVAGYDPCDNEGMLDSAACWISSGDEESAQALLRAARLFEPETPSASADYGNSWALALAYDFLRLYPGLSEDDKTAIEAKIEQALQETLLLLDSDDPSLWHGRSTLSANAWLYAVVLDHDSENTSQLRRRAQGHFLDALNALETTEAWPEGYNYWIQNRGFLFGLAASAYLNGLENSRESGRIRKILRRSGYWHIYAMRPDKQIEGLGDEGSRVDLKDETRRVIDLFASATQDPLLANFSTFIGSLHGEESYYDEYRWGFRLFNDPALVPAADNRLKIFESTLPKAALFGQGAFNEAYIRSGWDNDATFISFRAGHSFTHHGHYDAGHFSLFKGAPLAINSSSYGEFTGPNRLYYSIRSIAKNTLLILRPGESVKPNHLFSEDVADGGQRIVLPTGSAIGSVDQWRENLDAGLHLEGGRVTRFEHNEGRYTYIEADLTGAYNNPDYDDSGWGGKAGKVQRTLLYLYPDDRLLVYDRVGTVEPGYLKKWLLHTVTRPQMEGLQVLRGSASNGILESDASSIIVNNGRGYLKLDRFYPRDGVTRLVGGADYQYYIENDGDETTLDGANYAEDAANKPWFDIGYWRIEIQPREARRDDVFLIALSPTLDAVSTEPLEAVEALSENIRGVAGARSVALFIDSGSASEARFQLPMQPAPLLVSGLPADAEVELSAGTYSRKVVASAGGIAEIDVDGAAAGEAVLRWRQPNR